MTGKRVLELMDAGFTLHSGLFGFWLINPLDARCTNVHNNAGQSLVRRGLIRRDGGDRWVKDRTPAELRTEIVNRMDYFFRQIDGSMAFSDSAEGDLLKMVHKYFQKSKNCN